MSHAKAQAKMNRKVSQNVRNGSKRGQRTADGWSWKANHARPAVHAEMKVNGIVVKYMIGKNGKGHIKNLEDITPEIAAEFFTRWRNDRGYKKNGRRVRRNRIGKKKAKRIRESLGLKPGESLLHRDA